MGPRRVLELASRESLSPSVCSLVFRAVDDAPLGDVAGQWVNLYLKLGDEVIERSYSIARAPDPSHPTELEIAVTKVTGGPMSTALHALAVGDRIEMQGPFGFFTREEAHLTEPALFVGTGTGVTPLRAMIVDELRARPTGPPMVLLFGCRTEADLLYQRELEALAASHERFHYAPTLSRPGDPWAGRRGYVQGHLGELVGAMKPLHVYVCGLSKMVQDVRRILKEEHGLDRKRIHTERYD